MKKLNWLLALALCAAVGCSGAKDTAKPGTEAETTAPAGDSNADLGGEGEATATAEGEAGAAPTAGETGESAAKADSKPAEPAHAVPTERKISGDWRMWGGSPSRNMVNPTTGISLDFKPAKSPAEGEKLLWVAELGSQTYANPVVAEGIALVGTNNGAEKRPQHKGDRGVVMAFDAKTGEFKWQLTREKLPDGRVKDWPEQGICSTPCVEDGRVYVITNRCEVQCLDLDGFHDGKNDGPYDKEVDTEELDADIIWSLDMIEELGVFPHNLATSSPVVHGDYLFLVTSNGVDEAHLDVPSPRAPCFLCLNKNTGEVVWEDNTPEDRILHGQWSSPAVGIVNGKAQIYMPGGDGWLYAFDAEPADKEEKTAKLLWKFDLNPKESVWELGGAGTRNAIISTPVFHDNSVILAVGQDPEHAEGVGNIYRIDATKSGDISSRIETAEGSGEFKDNPNSGQIWHLGGLDDEEELIFRRTLSTVAIQNGLVYVADLSGFVHCIDFKTGERYWQHDTFSAVWGSTLVADGKIFVGDEDGELTVLKTGKQEKVLAVKEFNSSVYSTPTIANGILYVTDRSRLYAFETK